jgi:hypothetical protein
MKEAVDRKAVLGLIAAFVLVMSLVIPATASADDAYAIARNKKDYQALLKRLNYKCQSKIRGSEDVNAWVKAKNSPDLCRSIFDALIAACLKKQSNDVHPEGQAFVIAMVKTVLCSPGPITKGNKPKVKVSLKAGTLRFVADPQMLAKHPARKALNALPQWKPIHKKKRVWDILNEQLPPLQKRVDKACGKGITLTIHMQSWHQGGYGLKYPDLDIVGTSFKYVMGLVKRCKANKAVSQRINRVSIVFLGKERKDERAQYSLKGKTFEIGMGSHAHSGMIESSRDFLKGKGL